MRGQIDEKVDQAVADAFDDLVKCDDSTLLALRDRVVNASYSAPEAARSRRQAIPAAPRRRARLAVSLAFVLFAVIGGVAAANPGDVRTSVLESVGLLAEDELGGSLEERASAKDALRRTNIGQRPIGELELPEVLYEGDLNSTSGKHALTLSKDDIRLELYLAKTAKGRVCFAGVLSRGRTGGVSGCVEEFIEGMPFTVVNQLPTSDRALLALIASDEVSTVRVLSSNGMSVATEGSNAFAWLADDPHDVPSTIRAELTDGTTVEYRLTDVQPEATEAQLIDECSAARDDTGADLIACTKDVREGRYPSR